MLCLGLNWKNCLAGKIRFIYLRVIAERGILFFSHNFFVLYLLLLNIVFQDLIHYKFYCFPKCVAKDL